MRRREFIALIGGAAAAWPLTARAQQTATPVVGFLGSTLAKEWAKLVAAFQDGLRETGFVNYFGLQRFGTSSVKTSDVGLDLIRQDWAEYLNSWVKADADAGDQGADAPSYVRAPSSVYVTTTSSTAIGRRLGARSPRLETNGTRNSAPITSSGKIRMMNVSASGGLSDKRANSHKNGHSGRGLAPLNVGSGGPEGPFGPT